MSKKPASAPSSRTAIASAKASVGGPPGSEGRRIQTRRSGVHGKGVFAVQDLVEGETLIEYVGEVVSWKEALRRHPHDPQDPNHTFYFHIDEKHVIDAKYGGNSSRWINHSCQPNCEADEDGGRVFIKTLRNIEAGEELFYDYGLIIEARYTDKLKAEYPCWCGAESCRGTLLAPKDKKNKKNGTHHKAKNDVKNDLKGDGKKGKKKKD